MMNDNRGKVIFVLVDKYGKYGPMYRSMFPDLRNGTFFVSQPGKDRHPLQSCMTIYFVL